MKHFGYQITSYTGSRPEEMFADVVEAARAAEESGFDSLWVMDHFHQIPGVGAEDEPMLEAYSTLSALAAVTSRIRLGALVTGVVYRNPALLAKTVTTLDVISGGRAMLGIGASWFEAEARAYGYDYPEIGERFERLEETLRICRAMFSEPQVSLDGTHHSVDGAYNVPLPVSPGGPPILVGGGGERKTLRLVARYADYANFFGDADTIRRKIQVLARHCEDVGRDPADITTTRLGTMVIAEDREQARAVLDREAAVSPMGAEAYRALTVWGDPAQVTEQAKELLDAGLDGLIFNFPAGAEAAAIALAAAALKEAAAGS